MKRRDFLRSAAAVSVVASGAAVFAQAQKSATPATAGKLRVGMIGTAHSHAGGKMAVLRKMADVFEVVGVVEPDEKRRKGLEARKDYAGVPQLSEEQLLNLPGLQAVFVESAVQDQSAAALRAASASVHIHLEKPGGTSLAEFSRIVETCRSNKRIVQLGYMFRNNPAFELCFRAVREGWLGEIYEIHGVIGKVCGPNDRREQAVFPGGTMFELGCHLIDAMVKILGKPQKVTAHLRRTRDDGLADNTLAVLEYPRALATVRSCVMDVEGGARRQFIVCGDQGAATILPLEAPKLNLTLAQPREPYKKGTQPVELRPMPGRYDDQIADFAKVIRGQKESEFGLDHELAVFETVLAASGMK